MASDDTSPADGPQPFPRPPRERHREPPVIEAKAEPGPDVTEPTPDPAPDEVPAPATAAPGRSAAIPALAAVSVLALAVSAGAAYVAWQQVDGAASPNPAIATLQSRLDRIEATPRPAATPEQLAALEKRIAVLEQRPAPPQPSAAQAPASASAPAPGLSALEARVASVEKIARDAASAAATRPPPAPAPAPVPPAPRVDLSPLESRIAALEGQLASPKSDVRATEDPSASPNRSGDRTALAVVAQALSEAVDRGRPYPLELNAAEALGADAAQIKLLKPFADKGTPGRETLVRAFNQVSAKVLAAADPTPQGSMVDRLTASATKLVRIRPAGEAAGEDAPALVSRIEAALARGETAAGLRDFDRLPEASRATATAFAGLARQRVAAEAAARALRDAAMSALTRPKD